MEKLQEQAKNVTTSDIEQYLLAKEALKQLELKELEANKIRSKAQFVEEGQKSTRFFISPEKCRRSTQNIRVLMKNNMDTVTETRDLLGEAFCFYKKLYAAQPCDETIQAEFLEGAYPELVEDARDSCEGDITTEELKKAVEAMEKNKSLGLDGITTNFYKHFWHMLGDKLVQVYNCAFRVGHLSVSQQRGVISLFSRRVIAPSSRIGGPSLCLRPTIRFFLKHLQIGCMRCCHSSFIRTKLLPLGGEQFSNDNVR